MGLVPTPPASQPGSLPDIPVPNFTQQAQQTAAGFSAAGWWIQFCKTFWEAFGPGLLVLLGAAVEFAEPLIVIGLRLIQKFQGVNSSGFQEVLQQTVSDLVGVDLDESMFSGGMTPGGLHGPYVGAGQAFLKFMIDEMHSSASGTPAGGYVAATQWLGHAMGFAIREGNVETAISALPQSWRVLDGLRTYGVHMAQALGLGRLTHEALRSFMKILVADPLGQYLNSTYYPTLLSRDEILHYGRGGGELAAQAEQWLGWLGYSPKIVPTLYQFTQWKPSDTAVVAGNRIGALAVGDYNAYLVNRDVDPDEIETFADFATYGRAETHLNAAVANYITLLKNRWITKPQFEEQLQALGLSALEIKWAEQEIAPLWMYQTKELSESEITTAYEQGIVDQDYFVAWMQRWGYSAADQAVKLYLLLFKQEKQVTAEKLAQWRLRIACLTAKGKGQPLPPGFDANCNPT